MNKQERTERVENVEKWFKDKAPEFAKSVAPIYKLLQWKWQGEIDEIPDEYRILQFIESGIDSLMERFQNCPSINHDYSSSCGGIKVGYTVTVRGINPYISFTFKVSDFDL